MHHQGKLGKPFVELVHLTMAEEDGANRVELLAVKTPQGWYSLSFDDSIHDRWTMAVITAKGHGSGPTATLEIRMQQTEGSMEGRDLSDYGITFCRWYKGKKPSKKGKKGTKGKKESKNTARLACTYFNEDANPNARRDSGPEYEGEHILWAGGSNIRIVQGGKDHPGRCSVTQS